jgi:hypothetical protein
MSYHNPNPKPVWSGLVWFGLVLSRLVLSRLVCSSLAMYHGIGFDLGLGTRGALSSFTLVSARSQNQAQTQIQTQTQTQTQTQPKLHDRTFNTHSTRVPLKVDASMSRTNIIIALDVVAVDAEQTARGSSKKPHKVPTATSRIPAAAAQAASFMVPFASK